jgi:tRNA(Leu) C34 or U34 (ribose-2'-O)-methylase TrmL
VRAAVLLVEPKYPRNLAGIVRTCASYGVPDLTYTGERMRRSISELDRLPREERMKGYSSVRWGHMDAPFTHYVGLGYVPVAVEVRENSEMLQNFVHPEDALYVFGPEDGGLGHVSLRHCHRFVAVPTLHCLNLGITVATVLYDRMAKLAPESYLDMSRTEERGWELEPVDEVG